MASDKDGDFIASFFDDVNSLAFQEQRRQRTENAVEQAAIMSLLPIFLSALKERVRLLKDRFNYQLIEHKHTRVVQIADEEEASIELEYPGVSRYRISVDGATRQLRYGFENDRPKTLQLAAVDGDIVPKPAHGQELRGDPAQHAIEPFLAKISETLKLKM